MLRRPGTTLTEQVCSLLVQTRRMLFLGLWLVLGREVEGLD